MCIVLDYYVILFQLVSSLKQKSRFYGTLFDQSESGHGNHNGNEFNLQFTCPVFLQTKFFSDFFYYQNIGAWAHSRD